MRGAIAAEIEGVFERYVDEVFRHMWAEPKKMDDPEVVRAALEESGFDASALLARVREPNVKDRLLQNTQASVARGTFGSPTGPHLVAEVPAEPAAAAARREDLPARTD